MSERIHLHLVKDESSTTELVLRAEDGQEFALPVTTGLRGLVTEAEDAPTADAPRCLPDPDPRFATPLSMPPREIQARIRAGATTAQLAEEMGIAESRITNFAHPVLLERTQIAILARSAHPVRDGQEDKLTLTEVLAAAFNARGHSLSQTEWTAVREPQGPWIVRVTWQAGLSENSAEWVVHRPPTGPMTVEAHNAIAADLINPGFTQPVRTVTAIGTGQANTRAAHPEPPEETHPHTKDLVAVPDPAEPADPGNEETKPAADPPEEADEDTHQRRRRVVTPHWEDVLLGVRTSTKRPR